MIPKRPCDCPFCQRHRHKQAGLEWAFIGMVAILAVMLVGSLVSTRQTIAKGPVTSPPVGVAITGTHQKGR
jgi:hypothetical protein